MEIVQCRASVVIVMRQIEIIVKNEHTKKFGGMKHIQRTGGGHLVRWRVWGVGEIDRESPGTIGRPQGMPCDLFDQLVLVPRAFVGDKEKQMKQ